MSRCNFHILTGVFDFKELLPSLFWISHTKNKDREQLISLAENSSFESIGQEEALVFWKQLLMLLSLMGKANLPRFLIFPVILSKWKPASYSAKLLTHSDII